jgi:hypothetical protein
LTATHFNGGSDAVNLGQLAQLVINGGRAAAVCESCGHPFTCGATLKGCWCSEIKLSDETRAQLKSSYRNCLCRDCLEKLRQDSQD